MTPMKVGDRVRVNPVIAKIIEFPDDDLKGRITRDIGLDGLLVKHDRSGKILVWIPSELQPMLDCEI